MIIQRDMDIYLCKCYKMIRKILYKARRSIDFYSSRLRGYLLFNSSNIKIEHDVKIPFPETLEFEGICELKAHSQIKTSKDSKIVFGDNTMICSYTTLEAAGGFIKLGKNIIVGEYSTIQGQGGVIIEDNVLLASHVHIIPNNHEYHDVNVPIKYQPNNAKQITIKEDTWIGINVVILTGVTIGKHCIIGSGSIVKNDIPDYSIAVGVPARVVKKYDFIQKEWININ